MIRIFRSLITNLEHKTMSILDGLIGGVVSAGVTSAVSEFVESHGGVQGILTQFQEKGMGDTVLSWISTGTNLPISAEQIQSVLGNETITKLAGNFGIPLDQVAAQLSEHLPQLIDKLTPDGQIPAAPTAAG
jgi:uncharacterized protein YidB (DUF937 family)